jgi:DNA-binding NarL/FixJ family response regulator
MGGRELGEAGSVDVSIRTSTRNRRPASLVLASTRRRLLIDALGRAFRLEHAFDFDVSEHVTHGADASARICESVCPDVLLLDTDGESPSTTIGILRRLKGASPNTRILLLVASHPEEYALFLDYIEAGADGLLEQSAPFEEITAGLRAAAAGANVFPEGDVAELLRRAARERVAFQQVADSLRSLTNRELEILRLVGDGLGNDEIAVVLHISGHTVASHIQNVYRKMGVHSRAQAVAGANRIGLLRMDETA